MHCRKGRNMVEVVCPECGVKSLFQQAEVALYSQIQCEACRAILEVVEEDPLEVEVVEDDLSSDDEDDS